MSTHEPTVWLICYDVRNPRRLQKVYKIMRGYGDHIQLSVFRCVLTAQRYEELRARLLETIKPSEDQVLFFPLGRASSKRAWKVQALGQPLQGPERHVLVF